ncbi:multicopper oxidase domain-containing protein [Bradyrhizobium sp. BRP14]|nr:multicopper oxidase domain-containing protein [Bradyrhizobium sp. BRP14]
MKRRDFLAAALSGAAALSLPSMFAPPALAENGAAARTLRVIRRIIEVNGRSASVFGLEQPDGSRGLRFKEGDAFNVILENRTAEDTIVHWHGLTPPWQSDGVAGAPLPLLKAGETRSYNFPVGRAGTHWMHAHTLQEQALLAAPLIVAGRDDEARDEQEVVILLHDFSFKTPEELLTGLTNGPLASHDAVNMHGLQHGAPSMSAMDMPGMPAMDLNDIEYDAYLANDRTLDDPEVVAVERGGRVRLRIINGATATAFTIDTGDLRGELVAVDGHEVKPVKGTRFPMSMGQRIDIRLELPTEERAFPILALREGAIERTGIVLRPTGAKVSRIGVTGSEPGPVLDLALESGLEPLAPLALRDADRSFTMRLTGDMAAYRWGLATNEAIEVVSGQKAEVTMINTSMMAHPMHLHGHRFQVVAIDGRRMGGAVRDTVLVPPTKSVTIQVDADNPGQWAFHCHHLYHMAAGMMATFGYRT